MPRGKDDVIPLMSLSKNDPSLLDVGSAMEVVQGHHTPSSTFNPQQARRIIESLRFRGFEISYGGVTPRLNITRDSDRIEFRLVPVPGTMRHRPKYGGAYPDFKHETRATPGFYAAFREELWQVYRDLGIFSEQELETARKSIPLPRDHQHTGRSK